MKRKRSKKEKEQHSIRVKVAEKIRTLIWNSLSEKRKAELIEERSKQLLYEEKDKK